MRRKLIIIVGVILSLLGIALISIYLGVKFPFVSIFPISIEVEKDVWVSSNSFSTCLNMYCYPGPIKLKNFKDIYGNLQPDGYYRITGCQAVSFSPFLNLPSYYEVSPESYCTDKLKCDVNPCQWNIWARYIGTLPATTTTTTPTTTTTTLPGQVSGELTLTFLGALGIASFIGGLALLIIA